MKKYIAKALVALLTATDWHALIKSLTTKLKKWGGIVCIAIALVTLTGCAGMGMTPSRSNHASVTLSDCVIHVNDPSGSLSKSSYTDVGKIELVVEMDGEEQVTATQTITPKTTVKTTP